MKYRVILFLFLLTSGSHLVKSQDSTSSESDSEYAEEDEVSHQTVDPKDLNTTREYKSDNIELRKFDDDQWKKVVGSTDYNETHSKKTRGNSGSDSKEKKGARYAENDHDDEEDEDESDFGFNFNIGPLGGMLLKVIFYGMVIGLVVLLLYYVIKNTSLKTKVRTTGEPLPDLTTHVEDINDLRIDEMLAQALAAGNYRLTIRIYYLGLLKQLNASGLIVWKKDKTNRDYLTELYPQSEYFKDVRKLTLAYEQVWYGEYSVSSGLFQELSDEFKAIDHKLNTTKVH